MPKFFYIARDPQGNKITGVEDAPGQEEVINKLQAKNFVVISINPEAKETAKTLKTELTFRTGIQLSHYRIRNDDLVLFCRQLATLLGAGVTILKSLEIISLQVASRRLYNIIKELEKNMEQGLSLHEAMRKHKTVFSDLWTNLIESGEASGSLAVVLSRLAGYLERRASFRRKIISALIYPVILIIVAFGALLFLTLKIIPTFAEVFKGFGDIPLPLLTQWLIGVSNFLKKFIFIILIVMTVAFFIFRRYLKTPQGRRQYEKFQFALPIFGGFFHAIAVERFSSEMATLIESGVPILYSLDIAEHSINNLVVGDIIRKIKEDVRQGRTLSQPLAKSGFFEPMVVQMIAISEEIGELPQMFNKINAFYQEYSELFLNRFTAMFEPLMLIFMAFIIGIIVIGMFLPVFQIAQIK